MRHDDFDRAWEAVLGREALAAADAEHAFSSETEAMISRAPLSTEDRNAARFYLKAVRGLPTTTEKD